MNEQAKMDKHSDIDLFVSIKRGGFIHLMIIIESMLEDIIKHHYCKENVRDEFVFSVLTKENFGFKFKYELVCFILQNHYNEFYEKNNLLMKNLDILISDRNHFAHRKFFSANPENDKTDGAFYLEHYKTEGNKTIINPIKFNTEIYNGKLKQISEITYKLIELYKLMGINDSEIVKYYKE